MRGKGGEKRGLGRGRGSNKGRGGAAAPRGDATDPDWQPTGPVGPGSSRQAQREGARPATRSSQESRTSIPAPSFSQAKPRSEETGIHLKISRIQTGESDTWTSEVAREGAKVVNAIRHVQAEEIADPTPGLLPIEEDDQMSDSDEEEEEHDGNRQLRRRPAASDFFTQPDINADAGQGEQGNSGTSNFARTVDPLVNLPNRASAQHAAERQEEVAETPDTGGDEENLAADHDVEATQANDLPSLHVIATTLVPTQKWCPKAARAELARELSSLWQRVADNPEQVHLWSLLAMFAKCILPAGRGPRAGDAYSQARLVRERLRRWRAKEYNQLWEEAVALTKIPASKKRKKKAQEEEEMTQEKENAKRATTLAQEGQYARALQSLTSVGMAPDNASTKRALQAKHPPANGAQAPPPNTDVPQLTLSQLEVKEAVGKFRRGAAPGPSGLRPEHLSATLQTAPGRRDRALQSLTALVNVMAEGKVPDEVAPYLCGARLHAAAKKDGGIRPIAVGNILRRLTAKCIAKKVQEKAAGLLAPHQLGVGVRGGCEAILHTVRGVLEADPSLLCLQADFQNAFNLVSREVGLEEVARLFPEMLAWAKTCYGHSSHLLFGNASISSECGWQQGDPLASLLFSLVLHPLVKSIQERVQGLSAHAWYLDDGTFVGKEEELEQVLDILVREGPGRGLVLSTTITSPNNPKTTVWSKEIETRPAALLAKGAVWIEDEGINLLGAPIGSREYVEEEVRKKVEKVRVVTELLPLLQDPHVEFVLLRSCLSMPKFSFVLRTTDTTDIVHLLRDFDAVTRDGLARILGTALDDQTWQQAKMPVSLGGMGLRAAEDHAPTAYAASLLASQTLLKGITREDNQAEINGVLSPSLLEALTSAMGEEAKEEELVDVPQRKLGVKVDLEQQRKKEEMAREGSNEEKARLKSLTLPHSGDWLNVVPSTALGLHLRPQEFVMVARYRLGLPLYIKEGPCPSCRQHSDVRGNHAMCCGSGGERISRHNHLRDHLHDTAAAAGLGPRKEVRFLIPGNDSRPADVLLPHWKAGKDVALDVAVVNPCKGGTVVEAAAAAGYALNDTFKSKMQKAAEACQREGVIFLPMVTESFGGWHEVAVTEVERLGAALARQSGQNEDEAVRHLWGKLAILLQRGNAAILANRMPDFPAPAIDGRH